MLFCRLPPKQPRLKKTRIREKEFKKDLPRSLASTFAPFWHSSNAYLSRFLSLSLSLSDLSLSQFHLLLQEMAGKQSKGRKPETLGKGKVTPTQIAFIVDRYLCDNNFSSTRSMFRNEASSLIANSPIHEVYTPFCSTFCFFWFFPKLLCWFVHRGLHFLW